MDVNYFGLLRLAQEFGPAMRARGADGQSGAVAWVNLLSIFALSNFPPHGTYSASKAAVLSLAQCLRAELGPAGVRVINVLPGPIDDEWNQELPPPKIAPARLAADIVDALRGGAEDIFPGDIAQEWLARWRDNPKALERELAARFLSWCHEPCRSRKAMSETLLARLAAELVTGRIRVVDLTQTLSPDFPQIVLPPEMGQAWPFRIEEVSRYDERGPAWYWNNFSCSEHTGTHFDAPIHWISGRHLPDGSTDTISARNFIAPACVLDCSRQAATDADFLLTVGFLRNWEKRYGRIPRGSWVLMRTDWSKRTDPVAYQNLDETGQHTPGPDTEAVRFLVDERQVLGFGTEAIGTDAGQAYHLRPPYPCHYYMHGSGRYGLQCLTNLDLLPAIGSVVIAAPLKIKQGSGSPLRVLALVPAPANGPARGPGARAGRKKGRAGTKRR